MELVINSENFARFTARALPAGTALISAAFITIDPSKRSSSFRSPTAEFRDDDRKEFEHTSSAKSPEVWAGENLVGFISIKQTAIPRRARTNAASLPANPAPTIETTTLILAS
jgi:hypothetical protein